MAPRSPERSAQRAPATKPLRALQPPPPPHSPPPPHLQTPPPSPPPRIVPPPRPPRRYRLQTAVQYINPVIGQRTTDRNPGFVPGCGNVPSRICGAFRRTI